MAEFTVVARLSLPLQEFYDLGKKQERKMVYFNNAGYRKEFSFTPHAGVVGHGAASWGFSRGITPDTSEYWEERNGKFGATTVGSNGVTEKEADMLFIRAPMAFTSVYAEQGHVAEPCLAQVASKILGMEPLIIMGPTYFPGIGEGITLAPDRALYAKTIDRYYLLECKFLPGPKSVTPDDVKPPHKVQVRNHQAGFGLTEFIIYGKPQIEQGIVEIIMFVIEPAEEFIKSPQALALTQASIEYVKAKKRWDESTASRMKRLFGQ